LSTNPHYLGRIRERNTCDRSLRFFPLVLKTNSSTIFLPMSKTSICGPYGITDGAGLFSGVIKHLLNRGEGCPIVFAATHFHEVLNEEMLSPTQLPISFVHMAVLLTTGDGEILDNCDSSMLGFSDSREQKTGLRPSDGVTYLFKYVGQRYDSSSY
jgi:hypothetical protein